MTHLTTTKAIREPTYAAPELIEVVREHLAVMGIMNRDTLELNNAAHWESMPAAIKRSWRALHAAVTTRPHDQAAV